METLISNQITVSFVVGIMSKIMMVLLLTLALVMVRQATLMDKVIKLPVGGGIKAFVWSYFIMMTLLTVIVVLA